MKIRIKGNSLRLRLSQSEINTIREEGRVSDSIDFGQGKLIYSLQVTDLPAIKADYEGNFITVNVPGSQANQWLNTEQVGMEHRQPLPDGDELFLLIEKDFQCLKERPNEDESDLFKNPEA